MGVFIDGEHRLLATLDGMSKAKTKLVSFDIGFSMPYAAAVHENLEIKHPNGEAKFLEKAYKRKTAAAKREIKRFVKTKHGLENGIISGATIILEEAKRLCPVDTGALRASGYVSRTGVTTKV